jgi:hypothetical protein
MTIQDFLSSAPMTPAKTGSPGTESDWLHLCDMTVRGQHLQMVEKRILGGRHERDSVTIPVQPGRYTVEGRVMCYEGDRRISRMRVRPQATSVTLGDAAGDISVDLGGVAVADIDILAPSVDEHMDEYEDWIDDALFDESATAPVGVLRWEHADTEIPFADGGFGDGTYTVSRLMSGEQAVGLEVEFIAPGTEYPF